jgi:hypothetical protein
MIYQIQDSLQILYADVAILAGLAKTPRPMSHKEENKLLKDLENLLSGKGEEIPTCKYLLEARALLVEIMNWRDQNQNPEDGEDYASHFDRIEWIEEIIEAIDDAIEYGNCI